MHGLNPLDPGMKIDWGKTSLDYAKYRPGPPLSFYERLKKLNVGLKHWQNSKTYLSILEPFPAKTSN